MKKVFTLVCAAILSLGIMHAEVLLNEHFNQTTETLATNDDALPYSGEIADFGDWTNVWGSGDIYMSTTNLSYPDYKTTADVAGGSAEYKTTFAKRAASRFSKSVSSGSVYMAGIVKISSIKSTGKDYIWALGVGTSGINAASSKQYARPYVYQSGDGFKFGIAKLDETSTATYIDYTETEYSYGTYLLVVEYTWVDGEKNDVIKMYVNPTKGDKPATATCVPKPTQAEKKADAASFGCVVLCSSNTSQAACLIDELKVVTDWADLWNDDGGEGGGSEDPEPAISVSTLSAAFGEVETGEAAAKDIIVRGQDLTEAISVSSNNEAVAVSASSIAKEDAEAEGGFKLTLTLTAAVAGEGNAKVTLSSAGATDKVISVSWIAVVPPQKVSNIAALKATTYAEGVFYELETEPVVIRVTMAGTVLQDASGALVATDYLGSALPYSVGDKVKIKKAQLYEYASEYVDAFHTILVLDAAFISSDNDVEPFAVSAAEFDKYGPALVKVSDVEFSSAGQFEAGVIVAQQNGIDINLSIPAACDIVGEDIPAKADIVGPVVRVTGKNAVQIRASADVTNRVPRTPTDIANTAVQSKVVKVVRNGQVVILRDGKEFNLLGTEL